MQEAIKAFFVNGDVWSVVIRVLITALLSAGIGLIGTLIGRAVAKNKNSKIYKYAKTCVEAAEMKFPNEGKKMGPEKMTYVMDQLAIKFPRIKENTYLYNIAEAAVYELNRENEREAAIEEFEQKYGEKPLAVQESTTVELEETTGVEQVVEKETKEVKASETTVETQQPVSETKKKVTQEVKKSISKLKSF